MLVATARGYFVEASGSTCDLPSSSLGTRGLLQSESRKDNTHHRRTRIIKTAEGVPDNCFLAYGDGSSWHLGVYGEDQINFGGAVGTQEVCLIEMESEPIGNSVGNGPTLSDGIMGLNPGCNYGETSCVGNETDVISSLVRSGDISSYEFTMCYNETGGKLFLGPGEYPEDTMWFPTFPFAANSGEENGIECKFTKK